MEMRKKKVEGNLVVTTELFAVKYRKLERSQMTKDNCQRVEEPATAYKPNT